MEDPVEKRPVRRRFRNKGRQGRHVWTVAGRVQVVRRWWHSPEQGSVAPADAAIDGEPSSVSPGVREMVCRLNNDSSSFARTASNLERTAQIRLSREQIRQLVLWEGARVQAAQRSDAVRPSLAASGCSVSREDGGSTTRVYLGVDGVLVPVVTESEKKKRREKVVQKRRERGGRPRALAPRRRGAQESYKEFKVITFYDEAGTCWHEVFSGRSRVRVGSVIRREAERVGFRSAAEKIANVDGASWIRDRLLEEMPTLRLDGLGLDYYHLSENVHKARRWVFGPESEAGRAWADGLMETFRTGGYEAGWEALLSWRSGLRGKKRKAANRLLRYVAERSEMINYPEFRSRGWQIGSGPTESRCKTTTSRLKGRGRRWDMGNAEAVAALTCLMDNDQWQAYWASQRAPCT